MALAGRLDGEAVRRQIPAIMIGAGHGATHWIIATVYVLIPFLSKDLGLSYAEAGAVVSLFHMASFLANIGSGMVVDLSGRHVLVAGLSVVVGAIALMAISTASSVVWLYAPIIFIGLTNNLWHPAAISYLTGRYPGRLGWVLSLHTLGATFGDMLAPLAAGFLLVYLSWQTTALIGALPAIAVAAMLVVTLGIATGREEDGSEAKSSTTYLEGLRDLAANPAIIMVCLAAAFRSMTQNGLLLFLPLYLVDVIGAGPALVGVALMGVQAGGIVSGPLAGAWSDRVGRKPVVLAGLVATSVTLAMLSVTSVTWLFIALVCVLGFAMFSVRPVIHSWTMDLTPKGMTGSAISLLFGTQSAFTMLVPVLGGVMADAYGLASVFYALTATVAIAAVLTSMVPPGRVAEAGA